MNAIKNRKLKGHGDSNDDKKITKGQNAIKSQGDSVIEVDGIDEISTNTRRTSIDNIDGSSSRENSVKLRRTDSKDSNVKNVL